MRTPCWLAAILALSGCDVVFGLDRAPIDAAPIDAAPVTVTGQVARQYVHNDSQGKLLVESVPTGVPKVTVEGRPVPITVDPTGSFSFVRGADERAMVTSGDVTWSSIATQLDLVDVIYGRPDQIPPAASTELNINVNSPVIADNFVNIASTGVWSNSPPDSVSGTKFSLNWAAANFYAAPGLADATRGDELYFLRHEISAAGPNAHLRATYALRIVGITMKSGMVSGTDVVLAPLVPDACVHVIAARDQAITSFLDAYPTVTGPSTGWFLSAAPYPELGATFGISLAAAIVAAPGTVADVDVHYASPFPELTVRLAMSAASTRNVEGVPLRTSLVSFVPVTTQVACVPTPITPAAPAPVRPVLDETPLVDGVIVPLRADADPVLSWEVHGATADVYIVRLREIDRGIAQTIHRYLTTEPRLAIDRTLLKPGITYIAEIDARTGIPGAATGDFTRFTDRMTTGVYPATFRVTPAL